MGKLRSIRSHRVVWPFFVALGMTLLISGSVSGEDVENITKEAREIQEQARSLGAQYLGDKSFKSLHYAEERLIDGENFYRLKDYQRAAIIFMDIIESYSDHAAYPDALFYFADSLFLSRDFYGAKQWFGRLLDEVNRPGMSRFRQKAVERLIEIAIHVDDFEGVEKYFQQLGQSPDAEAHYIKGKYLYFRKEFDRAKGEFGLVVGNLELELKAAYFTAVILTQQGRYDEAIEVFKAGAAKKATTSGEQEVIDLMNLGLGRLYYEKDFVENAYDAYKAIGRYSEYYDTALYESAAVQIRAGNTIAAERILEVLTLAMPDSRYIPRAKLLRGHLLLMSGRYDEAEEVFDQTIGEFTPVMDQLDKLMVEQKDTRAFFSGLMERSLTTLDMSGALPPLIVKWVGEEPEVQRALELTADLGTAREYTRETERLVRLLEAVIDGPSRINAIPTLRTAKRRSQQLANRLVQLRVKLSNAGKVSAPQNAELSSLAAQRAQLQKELDSLPINDEQFQKREEKSRAVYQQMRKELQRNVIRLDKLVAMVVALQRFIEDPSYTEGATEQSIDALRKELERHQLGVEEMKVELEKLRDDVEKARFQVGVGDALDQKDEELKAKLKMLSDRERTILSGLQGETGNKFDKAFAAVQSSEDLVGKLSVAIDKAADKQIEELSRQVRSEREKVGRYRTELAALNDEAEEVVGGVTFENFSNVRKKFHELILKADVGIIDVAWMRKEEHKTRGTSLTRDRLAEIQTLDEEFNEVKSQGGETKGGATLGGD